MTSNKVFNVAVVVYHGVAILDFCGPMEMLLRVTLNDDPDHPHSAFKCHLISSTPTILAGGSLKVKTDMTFEEASSKINMFDILIVPGASPTTIQGMIRSQSEELAFIKESNSQARKAGEDEKVMLTVCTGALLAGATGALNGRTVTTHHRTLDLLSQICNSAGAKGADAVKVVSSRSAEGTMRYMDGGLNQAGIRVVTAGGVTCGLDASLYIAELKLGRDAAETVATVTEHTWQRNPMMA